MPRRRYENLVVLVREGTVTVLDGSDADRALFVLGESPRDIAGPRKTAKAKAMPRRRYD